MKILLDNEALKQIKNLESMNLEICEISRFFKIIIGFDVHNTSIDDIEESISIYKGLSKKHNVDENELNKLKRSIKSKLYYSITKKKLNKNKS